MSVICVTFAANAGRVEDHSFDVGEIAPVKGEGGGRAALHAHGPNLGDSGGMTRSSARKGMVNAAPTEKRINAKNDLFFIGGLTNPRPRRSGTWIPTP